MDIAAVKKTDGQGRGRPDACHRRRDPIQTSLVYVEKKGLPPVLMNRILRIAAFQNPEFYKAQAMRLSTCDKPRVIGCGEDMKRHLARWRLSSSRASATVMAWLRRLLYHQSPK